MKLKPFFITIFASLLIITGVSAANNLWEFYGGNLPTIQERAEIAQQIGIITKFDDYVGSYEQNTLLLEQLQNQPSFGGGGGLPVTDYETTLTAPMTSATTSLAVASIKTFDGFTITNSDISPAVYLIIEPGSAKQEIVKCTSISDGSTKLWTECVRGLKFIGTSESTVTANQKSHSAGVAVVMSNVHFFSFSPNIANTFLGSQTFSTSTASKVKMFFSTTTEQVYLWYDTESGGFGFSATGTEYAFGLGSLALTAVNPITIISGELKLATTTNEFDLSGNNLSLFFNSSLTSNASGISVATTTAFNWTGSHVFAGNFVANNASSTFTGDLNVGGNATTSGYLVVGTTQPKVNLSAGDILFGAATTTGTVSLGTLCFSGANCKNAPGNYLATSTRQEVQTSASGKTAVYTLTLSPGTLAPNSVLEIVVAGNYSESAGTFLDVLVDLGGTTICGGQSSGAGRVENSGNWMLTCILANDTPGTAQTSVSTLTEDGTLDVVRLPSLAIDTTISRDLVFSVDLDNGSDTAETNMWSVKIIRP